MLRARCFAGALALVTPVLVLQACRPFDGAEETSVPDVPDAAVTATDAEPVAVRDPGDQTDAGPDVLAVPLPGPVRFVFVTSTATNGNFNGGKQADALCQAAAARNPLLANRTFVSFLRAGEVGRQTLEAGAPWHRTDGTFVLDGGALPSVDVLPAVPIAINELGNPVEGAPLVWTGDDGTASPERCKGWTVGGNRDQGAAGNPLAKDRRWLAAGTRRCDSELRLYCFEK